MTDVASPPKPLRSRSPRRPSEPTSKVAPVRPPKSKDASKAKVSFYLDASTADKLAVASVIRRIDQSDLANEILGRALSSVTFYDRPGSVTRPASEPLSVSEIGSESVA